ncbi:hypothetical protein CYMTET_22722 [Cymbomonas tetramitiformis]|uniref:NAD-dependent epimerase/dehydratase domain-containing protein n=1 Tax=Cymbomonas tetramitiformis TaxID=36881 RepID=A0AAE0FZU7_9CHLO|nr:hypothetical protein CYMTET_22722 [Cymbomonas tetramitiformis]
MAGYLATGSFRNLCRLARCVNVAERVSCNNPNSLVQQMRHMSSYTHLIKQTGGYLGTGSTPQEVHGKKGPKRFLVTGATGQIGMELVPYLRDRFGVEQVIASDIRTSKTQLGSGPFVYCDVQDYDNLARVILESGVDYIVHLASLLSAIGERNPQLALKVNTVGTQNVLELARQHELQVFSPSTIAVYGESAPKFNSPDSTVKEPSTMYGITKVHLELLGEYYRSKYGVDFRSLRYPGVISSNTMPGGGTTDYAVEIYHEAIKHGKYECFLEEDMFLPMIYMPDCLKATVDLMLAPRENLTQACYNVTAMSFSPKDLSASIVKHVPEFEVKYNPDFRQVCPQHCNVLQWFPTPSA